MSPADVEQLCERIRTASMASRVPDLTVSVSIGVGAFSEGKLETLHRQLLTMADREMYEGRHRRRRGDSS